LQIGDVCIGTIVCRLERDQHGAMRGYLAMLAVDRRMRKRGIGSTLVKLAVREMRKCGADVVVLETEVTNKGALALYERLDFVRAKRLHRYYLNGVDAIRLKLWLTPPPAFVPPYTQ
jgi:peptide alpha-N-acetyltransferase